MHHWLLLFECIRLYPVFSAGTIPDDAPLDTGGESADGIGDTKSSSVAQYNLSRWDAYFDTRTDLTLPDRQSTVRSVLLPQ